MAREIGREVATPAEARQIVGVPVRRWVGAPKARRARPRPRKPRPRPRDRGGPPGARGALLEPRPLGAATTTGHAEPDRRREAARGVAVGAHGEVVTLGRRLPVNRPARRTRAQSASWRRDAISAFDTLGLDVHGYEVTHLDALGHVFLEERTWGDRQAAVCWVGWTGFGRSFAAGERAIVTRGVLLDVAAVRGVDWLLPTDGISVADIEAAMARAGVSVRHRRRGVRAVRPRVASRAEGDAHDEEALTKASCRRRSGGSGNATSPSMSGTASSSVRRSYERVRMPLHQIGLARMGLWILDCPDLEALAAACAKNGRSDFLLVVAPLKIPGGTASAVNPLAIF